MAKAYAAAALLLVFLIGAAQAQPGFTSIDCGATEKYTDSNTISWQTDEGFTSSGLSSVVPNAPAIFLQTLRYFSNVSALNCYTLPVTPKQRYLLRASFYYGNYDGLASWPTFQLAFNGRLWRTISRDFSDEQSKHDYISYEVIRTPKQGTMTVCLKSSDDQNIPFINALEVRALVASSSPALGLETRPFYLSFRQDLGAKSPTRYPKDVYDRMWYPVPQAPAGSSVISTSRQAPTQGFPSKPPPAIFSTAFQGPKNLSPLNYNLKFASSVSTIYVDLYFWDFRNRSSSFLCAFDISMAINGVSAAGTLNLGALPQIYSFYATSGVAEQNTVDISLIPLSNSTLPPVLNAIEVYAVDSSD